MSADVQTIQAQFGERARIPLNRKRTYIVHWPDSPHNEASVVTSLERARRLARNETDWDERVCIYRCELTAVPMSPSKEKESSDPSHAPEPSS